MNNSIIDLVIRIKNGYMAAKDKIESPHSVFKAEILKKLKALNYIKDYRVEGDKIKNISIVLLYKQGQAIFTDVKIYSKPGRKWYVAAKELKPVLGGLGVSILSTPVGILTNNEAKKKNIGGELLFDIW